MFADTTLVRDAFESLHEIREANDPWDKVALHSSDLVKCAREVWARRSGKPMLPLGSDVLRQFRIGVDFEEQVLEALEQKYAGTTIEILRQAEYFGLNNGVELVGHPDFILRDTVTGELQPIEVKTTTFVARWNKATGNKDVFLPKEPAERYVIQAGTNAIQIGSDTFRIVVVCRNTGKMVEFVLQTSTFAPRIRALQAHYALVTGPNQPEPHHEVPPAHIASFACKFCAYAGCENNKNPLMGVL